MRVLVSNDDGVDAPGIHVLADALAELGEVWIVAPATEQSAKSHALTMHSPLRVLDRGPRTLAVEGTPADAVYLALHHLLPGPPDLVVSGINRGANIADDTWYSGTVAAAREGAMCGIPALAVSLFIRNHSDGAELYWHEAAQIAVRLARSVMEAPSSERTRTVFNLNVPNLPAGQQQPLRVCPLGGRHYEPSVVTDRDPRGRRFYWVGGAASSFDDQEGTDGYFLYRGHPTLTPLHLDGTHTALLASWRSWLPA